MLCRPRGTAPTTDSSHPGRLAILARIGELNLDDLSDDERPMRRHRLPQALEYLELEPFDIDLDHTGRAGESLGEPTLMHGHVADRVEREVLRIAAAQSGFGSKQSMRPASPTIARACSVIIPMFAPMSTK